MKKLIFLALYLFCFKASAQDFSLSKYKVMEGFASSAVFLNFSPKNTYFALSTANNQLELYNQNFEKIWSHQGENPEALANKMVFSPDEKYLVFGKYQGFGDMAVLRLSNQKIIQRIRAFDDYIKDIEISPDGKYLVAVGNAPKLLLWEWKNEQYEKLQEIDLSHITSEGWSDVVFSPDGKTLVISGNHPHLLIYALQAGKLVQTQYIQNKAGLYAYSLDFHPSGKFFALGSSKGTLIYQQNKNEFRLAYSDEILSFEGRFAPNGNFYVSAGKNELSIYQFKNAQLEKWDKLQAHKGDGIGLVFSSDKNFMISSAEDHKVIIWTLNGAKISQNLPNQKGEEVKPSLKPEKSSNSGENQDLAFDLTKKGKNYLLLIGIDKYKYWNPLSNARKDAQDLKKLLINRYTFQPENIFELYDEEASLKGIIDKITEAKKRISDEDNLLIYFSGHGFYNADIQEGYWIPNNAPLKDETQYLSNSTLLKYLKPILAKHIFLVVDACFSGSLLVDNQNRGYIENVEKFKSRWGLTSGHLEFVSDGEAKKNSPFATYFLKFLQENNKKRFTASELVNYVKSAVANNYEQTPLGNPLKGMGDEGGEFVFYLKY